MQLSKNSFIKIILLSKKLLLIDQTENEEIPALGSNLKHSTTWMYLVWSSFTPPKQSKPLPWIVYSDEVKSIICMLNF